MQTEYETAANPANPKAYTIIGWIITILLALFMGGMGIVIQLTNPKIVEDGMIQNGYPVELAKPILIAEIVCVVLYLIPQTAVFGAILLTGYLGGATATHVRIEDHLFFVPIIFGVLVWLALYFREPRLRALAPYRSNLCCKCKSPKSVV